MSNTVDDSISHSAGSREEDAMFTSMTESIRRESFVAKLASKKTHDPRDDCSIARAVGQKGGS